MKYLGFAEAKRETDGGDNSKLLGGSTLLNDDDAQFIYGINIQKTYEIYLIGFYIAIGRLQFFFDGKLSYDIILLLPPIRRF